MPDRYAYLSPQAVAAGYTSDVLAYNFVFSGNESRYWDADTDTLYVYRSNPPSFRTWVLVNPLDTNVNTAGTNSGAAGEDAFTILGKHQGTLYVVSRINPAAPIPGEPTYRVRAFSQTPTDYLTYLFGVETTTSAFVLDERTGYVYFLGPAGTGGVRTMRRFQIGAWSVEDLFSFVALGTRFTVGRGPAGEEGVWVCESTNPPVNTTGAVRLLSLSGALLRNTTLAFPGISTVAVGTGAFSDRLLIASADVGVDVSEYNISTGTSFPIFRWSEIGNHEPGQLLIRNNSFPNADLTGTAVSAINRVIPPFPVAVGGDDPAPPPTAAAGWQKDCAGPAAVWARDCAGGAAGWGRGEVATPAPTSWGRRGA